MLCVFARFNIQWYISLRVCTLAQGINSSTTNLIINKRKVVTTNIREHHFKLFLMLPISCHKTMDWNVYVSSLTNCCVAKS